MAFVWHLLQAIGKGEQYKILHTLHIFPIYIYVHIYTDIGTTKVSHLQKWKEV